MKNSVIAIMILFSSGVFSQGIYNNGGKLVIGSGAYLTIGGPDGGFRNESNGTNGSIDLSGKLKMSGNFTNNVANENALNPQITGGEVIFNGTAIQTIGGSTTIPVLFPNMTINNGSGVAFSANGQVNENLTFENGLIDIGGNDFVFGDSSAVLGTPSSASMIITSGGGKITKVWPATGSFTFPIGENIAPNNYLPVSINLTTGTLSPQAGISVKMNDSKYPDPTIDGAYLKRYWTLSQSGISDFAYDVALNYSQSDVVGVEDSIKGMQVAPLPITILNPADTASNQLLINGLTSFGTFTGAEKVIANRTLNITNVYLESLYQGAGAMRQAFDELGAHWPTGVADHIVVELHDPINYSTIAYTSNDVELGVNGTATISIPATYNGSYYITIKHRNSIETTTAVPVSFAVSTINQSFGDPLEVYGANLGLSTDNYYLIYTGDVDQDGAIDSRDYISVDNDSYNFVSGYVPTDVNGDGVVDSRDYIAIDNNNYNFIGTVHP